jgi:hypothetical protein
LLEYAFGSQPSIADAARMSLDAAIVSDRLHVTFPRRLAGTAELQYSVQVSPDLVDWNSLSATQVSTAASDAPGFEEVTFRAVPTIEQQAPLYIRLRAVLP